MDSMMSPSFSHRAPPWRETRQFPSPCRRRPPVFYPGGAGALSLEFQTRRIRPGAARPNSSLTSLTDCRTDQQTASCWRPSTQTLAPFCAHCQCGCGPEPCGRGAAWGACMLCAPAAI